MVHVGKYTSPMDPMGIWEVQPPNIQVAGRLRMIPDLTSRGQCVGGRLGLPGHLPWESMVYLPTLTICFSQM